MRALSKVLHMSEHNSELDKALLERSGIYIPKMYGALELANMDLPPMKWIVKGVLPVGVTHFAGKEKMFKSFAVLGLCIAAVNGTEYLNFSTEKCEALYFDLESSEGRPHDRLNLIARTMPLSNDCHIITRNNLKNADNVPQTLDNCFTDTLNAILEYNKNIRLVVVDVFSKIRSKRRASEDTYSWDYRDVSMLKDVADQHDVAIVIINHTVKGDLYDDDFDTARGSGINAACDCMWLLKKDKNSELCGILKIKGRDVEPQEYSIQFDTNDFIWKRFSTSRDLETIQFRKEYERSNIRQTLEAITQWGVIWEGSPKDLIDTSYQTNTAIGLDTKQLGLSLLKFESLLREDGFTFAKHREAKGTQYRFVNNNNKLT